MHKYTRIDASESLKELAQLETPPKQFYYLRSLDPFVFEEMVLIALERHGYKVIRNKRYTGDGGIDGRAYLNGQHYLIQSKRYRKHINAAHVEAFAQICKRRKGRGLFVHTGRTGAQSRRVANHTNVEIISGARLLKLLSGPAKPAFSIKDIASSVFGLPFTRVFNQL